MKLPFAVAVGVLLMPGALALSKPRPAPPYAYLGHNSYSLKELIQQVQNSPKLQQRYAKHFGIPAAQVVKHFRYHLMESYVPQTKVYDVWCVKPDGTRFVVKQRFAKGTRVLALKNGQPVMKWACGNPLSRKMPEIREKVVRVKKVLPRKEEKPVIVRVDTPFEPVKDLMALAPAYEVPPSDLFYTVRRPPVPTTPPSKLPWQLLPALVLPKHEDYPPPVIPEPATLALLAGAAGMGLLLRRRR